MVLLNNYNGFQLYFSIRCNSIEFLRPVFLYALCNPIQIPNAGAIWSVFLKQRRLNKSKTQNLLEEIFIWCRVSFLDLNITYRRSLIISFIRLHQIDVLVCPPSSWKPLKYIWKQMTTNLPSNVKYIYWR